ncbi:hypothetical protein BC332_25933 [Capsicum chinense]|nr:hypothetical protein BC332_25933 [Capsicum chinense]
MPGVIAKNIIRGTPEHGYAVLPSFSYVFNGLNPKSINFLMVHEESSRFIYYFMAFGASICGYAHMRKIVVVDGTHLSGKYEGMLLFAVAQDTQNHIYHLAYCVVDKENDTSWASSSRSLKPLLSMNQSCALSTIDTTAACLDHEVGFEKWSRAHFSGNRFNVMTTNIVELLSSMLHDEREYPVAAIFNSIAHRFGEIFRKRYTEVDNLKTIFVPVFETVLRKNMIEGDKLYVNINGSTDEFIMLGYGYSVKVNLSRQSCSCRKYDLMKLTCTHAMAALRLKHGDEYDISIYNYSSQIYSKESYLLAYLEPIYAAPLVRSGVWRKSI